MTDPRTISQDLQGQVLDTISKTQEAVVKTIREWADAVQSLTPSRPTPSMPFADKLPKPAELVANAYDFAEKLLATQRKFAEDVLRATAPVLNGKDDSHAAKKAGSSAK